VPQYDLPLAELRTYAPALAAPPDHDDFWDATLAEARRHPLAVTCTPVDSGLTVFDSFDVSFAGFGGPPSARGSTCRSNARARCPPSSSTLGTAVAVACHMNGCCVQPPGTPTC